MFGNGAKTVVLLAALGGVMIGVGSFFGRGGAIIGLMLGVCTRDEVRGVLAHELAHLRNRDILIGSVAAAAGMTISRSREFDADRVGADIAPAQASHFIVNPLTGRNAGFANLFRTHPPTQERVARLRGQHV